MNLYHDSMGPSLELGVETRLGRLDRDLRVTFSRWALDLQTSYPILSEHFDNLGEPIFEPAFHLWVWSPHYGRYLHIKQYTAESGFGHREVAALEADAARHMTPSEMLVEAARQREARQARKEANHAELRQDIINANESRIADLLDLDPGRRRLSSSDGSRDAKIVSYAGQGSRATPGRVRKDDHEDGWEKPPPDHEL